tara:strand:- start:1090 stop:1893 length:804 start_codon:yes stop_codon:yes gene_type:complete
MNGKENAEALKVLVDNIDFFVAPFTDPEKFQQWGQKYADNNEFISLSGDINRALKDSRDFNNYRHALIGNQDKPAEKYTGLLYGESNKIKQIISWNHELRGALIKHANDACIKSWYNDSFVDEYRQRNHEINKYKRACSGYINHLNSVIAKINDPDNFSSKLADKKLMIIGEAKNILDHASNENYDDSINSFMEALKSNKITLAERRDTGFITFVKALGLLGASIFTLGIATFATYHRLFGKYATHANRLVLECESTHANKLSAVGG